MEGQNKEEERSEGSSNQLESTSLEGPVMNRREDLQNNAEEDVPEDFFDDFLKEDFMAGLDIVDEAVEDQDQIAKRKIVKTKKRKKVSIRPPSTEPISPEVQQIEPKNRSAKLTERDLELRKLDKELDEMRQVPSRNAKLNAEADNFDIRRDPEKTRQAIQRDKIKSARDKEKRLITDIVQTGLVPPGMELEVDMNEMDREEPLTDLRQKIRKRKDHDSKKIKTTVSSPAIKKRSTSTVKAAPQKSPVESTSRKSPERPSRRSPRRSPARLIKRSPKRRSPALGRSFLPSPERRTSRSPRRNSRSPRRNSRSPRRLVPYLKRSRSPRRSPLFWKRSRSRSFSDRRIPRYRRSRSPEYYSRTRRDRSFSPMDPVRRRRTRSRSPKRIRKEEKVSFLEELVHKLNETHPQHQTNVIPPANFPAPHLMHHPIMPIVPQSQPAYFNPMPMMQHAPVAPQPPAELYDPYDESFFIGNVTPLVTPENNQYANHSAPATNPVLVQNNPVPKQDSHNQDVTKLFEDKRIKLSDFLALTAKPQVSNTAPRKLQEKIKVIQRCQNAIQMLNERRFTGPLVVHKTKKDYKLSDEDNISPLLRKPIVRLPFTTPGAKNSDKMDFVNSCQTLLYQLGIEKELKPSGIQIKLSGSVPPPKEVTLNNAPPPPAIKPFNEPPKPVTKTMGTQTDKELSSCKKCLVRKGILYANCGTQAGDPKLTFSVSTQANEADFYAMIPKTQSLASLTPAQLLGKQSMMAEVAKLSSALTRLANNQDNVSRNRHVPSPPQPPSIVHYGAVPLQPHNQVQQQHDYPPSLFNINPLANFNPANQSSSHHSGVNSYMDNTNRRGGYYKRF